MHGDDDAVEVTRAGGSTATTEPAVVYTDRTEWRKVGGDRRQVITRRIVLPPGAAAVPIGSTFAVTDGGETRHYTVEGVGSSSASGSQVLHGIRHAAVSVSRPGYYGDE